MKDGSLLTRFTHLVQCLFDRLAVRYICDFDQLSDPTRFLKHQEDSGRGLLFRREQYESIYASATNVRGRFNGEPTNALKGNIGSDIGILVMWISVYICQYFK